jgi:ankyrin repeat protein
MRGGNVNEALTSDGQTPLYIASQNGHKDVVEVLLANGAKVDQALTTDGQTPLFTASTEGHKDVVEVLLAKGANVHQATTDDGQTPLFAASIDGYKEVVKVLLANGAEVDQATTDDGNTPLFTASENGNKDVVEVLLDHKADVYKANNEGYTPVTIAVLRKHQSVLDVIKPKLTDDCAIVMQTIIDKNLAIGRHIMFNSITTLNTEIDTLGKKVLDKCLSKLGYTVPPDDSCDLLLDALRDLLEDIENSTIFQEDYDKLLTKLKVSGEPDTTNLNNCLQKLGYRVYLSSTTEETKNSLLKAIENRDELALGHFISQKVFKIDDPIRDGDTPLFIASQYGYKDVVEFLVDNGADVNKMNNDGKTPLMVASQNQHKDVVEVLVKKVAKEVQRCQEIQEYIENNNLAIGKDITISSYEKLSTQFYDTDNLDDCLSTLGYKQMTDKSCDKVLDGLKKLFENHRSIENEKKLNYQQYAELVQSLD